MSITASATSEPAVAERCQGFITNLVLRCGQGDEAALGELFDLTFFLVAAAVNRAPSRRRCRRRGRGRLLSDLAPLLLLPADRARGAAWVFDQAFDLEDASLPREPGRDVDLLLRSIRAVTSWCRRSGSPCSAGTSSRAPAWPACSPSDAAAPWSWRGWSMSAPREADVVVFDLAGQTGPVPDDLAALLAGGSPSSRSTSTEGRTWPSAPSPSGSRDIVQRTSTPTGSSGRSSGLRPERPPLWWTTDAGTAARLASAPG